MSLQNDEQSITKAEKLLANIEQFSDNLISAYEDELINSPEPVTLKRENFSKINVLFMKWVKIICISDITIHLPNGNDLATMDGISSSDDEEAKILIPSQVLLMSGQNIISGRKIHKPFKIYQICFWNFM